MIQIQRFDANSFNTGYLDLMWEVVPTTELMSNYLFFLYRSLSEEGPWDPVTPLGISERYFFRDSRAILKSKILKYFYKLEVKNISTDETNTYGPVTITYKPDLAALEIARLKAMDLKVNSGQRCFIFKEKKLGSYCSCYDEMLDKVTRSNCMTCFGTGIIGGYCTPIISWVNIIDNASSLSKSSQGDIEKTVAQAELASYPLMNPRDIIVDGSNRRWRVASPIRYVKKSTTIIRQSITIEYIDPTEVEYKIPIRKSNYDRYEKAMDQFERVTDYYTNEDSLRAKQLYGKKRFKDPGLKDPQADKDFYEDEEELV